jgi:hypothetical protein
MNKANAKFFSAAKGATAQSVVWTQIMAMILAMLQAGGGSAAILAEVQALLASSALPAWEQTLLLTLATTAINILVPAIPLGTAAQSTP